MEGRNRIRMFIRAGLAMALIAAGSAVPYSRAQMQDSPRVVNITAKRFGFAPNVINLKKGEPVTLRLTSEDVTHGLFMRALKLDEEIVPGKTTEVTITPQTAGKFTTICDHFCGSGHGNMNMTIVVE